MFAPEPNPAWKRLIVVPQQTVLTRQQVQPVDVIRRGIVLFGTALQERRRAHPRLGELHQQPLEVRGIVGQRQARVPTGELGELVKRTLSKDEIEATGIPQRLGLCRL